jgi:hypothetical protein
MAMQAPKDDQTIEELRQEQAANARRYLVGLVTPSGVVQEITAVPDKDPNNGHVHGIDVCRMVEGQVTLTAYARRAGWTFLEERCREDGCPGKYQAWLETVKARMDGHRIQLPTDESGQPDMSAIYPPSVLEQRRSGGLSSAKPMRFVPGKGLVAVDEVPESEEEHRARVAKRCAELGIEAKPADKPEKAKR